MGIMGWAWRATSSPPATRSWFGTTRFQAEAIESATVADCPPIWRRCGVVMVCVSDTPDVVEVVEGDDGVWPVPERAT